MGPKQESAVTLRKNIDGSQFNMGQTAEAVGMFEANTTNTQRNIDSTRRLEPAFATLQTQAMPMSGYHEEPLHEILIDEDHLNVSEN